MASDPDFDVTEFLNGAVATSGTNLFTGPVQAYGTGIPAVAVFVLASGGAPPVAMMDGSSTSYCFSTVQIRTRSAMENYWDGLTLAKNVRNYLNRAAISGYVSVRVRESEPNYLGQDELGFHNWSINIEMQHKRAP